MIFKIKDIRFFITPRGTPISKLRILKHTLKILPKSLLPRLLIIFFVPLISIQCLAIFLFYDRHWEKITTRFANIASNQVNLIIDDFEKNNSVNEKMLGTLNIKFEIEKNKDIKNT